MFESIIFVSWLIGIIIIGFVWRGDDGEGISLIIAFSIICVLVYAVGSVFAN